MAPPVSRNKKVSAKCTDDNRSKRTSRDEVLGNSSGKRLKGNGGRDKQLQAVEMSVATLVSVLIAETELLQ
jgi:hypothetical protein